MLEANTEYSKIEQPTRAQLYGLRSRTVFTRNRRIHGRLVSIEEKVATHGCFSDGWRRIFEATIAAGTIELGGFGRSQAREIIAWAPTMEEVVEIAAQWLDKKAKQTAAK